MFAWLKAWLGGRRTEATALHHDVLRAQAALFRLARREGFDSLRSHPDAAPSALALRYPQLGVSPGASDLLCEAMQLLGAHLEAADFEVQLDAWIEIAAAHRRLKTTDPAVRCIRDATLALQRGVRVTQAIRIGRGQLPASDRLATTDLTDVFAEPPDDHLPDR